MLATMMVTGHTFGAASFVMCFYDTTPLPRYNRNMLVIDIILSVTNAIISLLTLGLAIGFSPLIYGAFVSTFSYTQPQRRQLQTALLGGITAGTVVLLASGAAIGALYYYATTSGIYKLVIAVAGGVLVGIAVRRWVSNPTKQPRKQKANPAPKPATFAVIGFSKTILSASSIAAALVSSTIFATIGNRPIATLSVIVVICAATLLPFVVVAQSKQASRHMKSWMAKARSLVAAARTSDSHVVPFALACCGLVLIAYALSH